MKNCIIICLVFLFCHFSIAQTIDPVHPSGNDKFVKFLNSNFKLNKQALSKDLSGDIEIEFRVSETGKLDSFNIVKDIGEGVALDFIETIRKAGDWMPAFKDGVKIAKWVVLPYKVLSKSESYLNLTEDHDAFPIDGIESFKNNFLKNFNYPEKAINASIQGNFTLTFIVKEDGSLSSIKLIKDPGYEIYESAVRALRRSGKWIPAKLNGKSVASKTNFDFNLSLKEFRRGVM